MHGTVVGILRGGPSSEHDVSLKTGAAMLKNLCRERHTPKDIFIDRQGVWHERGIPVPPEKVLRSIDVALLGFHGEWGEDGEVQKLLERYGVPYTGSDSLGSALAMHKVLAKEHASDIGLLTPRYRLIEKEEDIDAAVSEIVKSFLQPVVVKPVASGSSVGIAMTHGHAPLVEAAMNILQSGGGALVEERIRGREATVGVVEGLRGEEYYVLPPIEIVPPPTEEFFSYEAKYGGGSREICPAPFPKKVTKELMESARKIHKALGLRHYSRTDFMVSPHGIYYLETNTLPGMTEESLLPKALAAVGMSFQDFLTHLIDLALKRKTV
ncbi:MAG: D-alanine--D-alanine ligase [Candidatus Pacebacteria bacterium]|nr:D-alanine--D-alanine ligase [Candidatus Paceibacterota bacterium]